ncbi:MAG: DEAD/DEAH box helicase [Verrucomicrobia bacterium]|nr:DEAD/DEAH box helicase [Verrucomicrobiota bacterium]
MAVEIAISPTGRLYVQGTTEPASALDEKWTARFETAFGSSAVAGLLLLASDALTLHLPPSLAYWRDFARLYLQRLCRENGGVAEAAPVLPAPAQEELAPFAQQAPPMRGGEFLSLQLLEKLWQELGEQIARETAGGSLDTWLKARSPHWHTVGRVTFHLAENKRDPDRPFAFLATYTHRLSSEGKPQHLPLARALQEYAGAQNKAALTNLLAPVQRAAEKSKLARELLESRHLFQALAWTPRDAYRFLRDIPSFEESGLLVRVPDWWRAGRPARAQVQVRIGNTPSSLFGLDSLMDFSAEVALDGEPLTPDEWNEVTGSQENLVRLKGQWVEIDRDRLKQVLEHWRRIQRQGGAISFLEGMRLLAGFGRDAPGDPMADPETRVWSRVVPGDWLREMLAAMRDPSSLGGFDPNRDLRTTLRGYQREGVHWLWFMTRLGLGACLADDMGLGKTVQTIATLLQIKRENRKVCTKGEMPGSAFQPPAADRSPSLLVAPASLLANWKSELTRFAPTLDVFFVHPSEAPVQALKDAAADPASVFAGRDLVITTYGVLARFTWLRKLTWNLVILDEAQAIKNAGARQTRAVKELRAAARVALTGTPIENRLGDLWSLFDFLCPGLLGTAAEFGRVVKRLTEDRTRHFAPLRNLTQPYILRRLKTDRSIVADLPDKTELTAWCGLSKAQATLYGQSVAELADRLKAADGIQRRGLVLAFLTRFKQICNHPSHWLGDGQFDPAASGKFVRLREVAEEIAARQEKALIFTQFKEITGPLAAHLERVFGSPGLILHGSTPVKERQRLVQCFQQDGEPSFFILSLKAGGTGLNLTAASHVIHFDRWWNPAVENQATDRAFRIGQKKNVLVHKFVCRGTIEERIDQLIADKKGLAAGVLEGAERMLTEMPDEELLRFVALDLQSAVDD